MQRKRRGEKTKGQKKGKSTDKILKHYLKLLQNALLKFHKILETAAAGVLYSSVYASARDNNTSNFKSYTLSKELRDSSINVSYSRINIQYFMKFE